MSEIVHDAIIVTAPYRYASKARAQAKTIGMTVSGLVRSPTNDYATFLIAPDGSKEGWHESAAGDQQRWTFMAWLKSQEYGDGSSHYDWVAVRYGHHEKCASIEGEA